MEGSGAGLVKRGNQKGRGFGYIRGNGIIFDLFIFLVCFFCFHQGRVWEGLLYALGVGFVWGFCFSSACFSLRTRMDQGGGVTLLFLDSFRFFHA